MGTKSFIKSKNIWFNVLSILAIIVAELSASADLKEILGANAFWLIIIGAAINMIIRFYTDKPIQIKRQRLPLSPVDEALREEAEEQGMS